MTARILAVVDRGSNGTAEQLDDLLDFCVGVRVSFGTLDLGLRGCAVACALTASREGDLSRAVRRLQALIRTGVGVWADEADLASLGSPAETVLDGVVVADTDALALRWHEYEEVWFL